MDMKRKQGVTPPPFRRSSDFATMSTSKGRDLYWACHKGSKRSVIRVANYSSAHYVDFKNGDTPLHQACKRGWLDIVKLLIERYGCDPDVTDKNLYQSPLHYACQYGHINVVKYLINERGCNVLLNDKNKLEPLDHALNNNHTDIANYVCKHCISSDVMLKTDRYETTSTIVRAIVHKPDNLEWKSADGDDILQLVCRCESIISRMPSAVMLEWLNEATFNLVMRTLAPKWKTADDNTLFQLVCQSESCISHVPTVVMLKWQKNESATTFKQLKTIVWDLSLIHI